MEYQPEDSYIGECEYNDTYDSACILENKKLCEADNSKGVFKGTDIDIFKFIMQEAGVANIDVGKDYLLSREDEHLNVSKLYGLDSGCSRVRLPAGTYYIEVSPEKEYTVLVDINYESAEDYEQEFNNVSSQANEIEVNHWYTGNFNGNSDNDIFSFNVEEKSDVIVQIKIPRQAPGTATMFLYNESLKEIANQTTSSNPFVEMEQQVLEHGKYFVKVVGSEAVGGDYSINVACTPYCKLNKTSLVLPMGKTDTLKLVGAREKVNWKSSNKKIAVINTKGVVTVKGVGSTYIVASYKGKEYKCKVTGKSDFEKGFWGDFKITKISENKLYMTLEEFNSKRGVFVNHNIVLKIDSTGKNASTNFKCTYGKRHAFTFSYSKKKDILIFYEDTVCSERFAN